MEERSNPVERLLAHGVRIPHPPSVCVGEDVKPERIAPGAVLHPGTRLAGAELSIGPGCEIGEETPATVIQCQLTDGVRLKGGYFEGSVFLSGSSVGSSAHVRPGCLLEEQAGAAHAVGLKQTILFPFVTLGSLINFCDVWMAGGTSRRDHSEVGSSFIHFNFTPHGDKATASLIGDVARGILLKDPPVFLGGQGGVVGPVEMADGVVQAAGSISRRSLLDSGHLYQSAVPGERWAPYIPGRIRNPEEKLLRNLRYLGSLSALCVWYREIRMPVMDSDPFALAGVNGAIRLLEGAIAERLKQLEKWLKLVRANPETASFYIDVEKDLRQKIDSPPATESLKPVRDALLTSEGGYIERIQALPPEAGEAAVIFFQQEQSRFTDGIDD